MNIKKLCSLMALATTCLSADLAFASLIFEVDHSGNNVRMLILTISENVSDIGPALTPHEKAPNGRIGYYYRSVGLLWFDFWTWDGQYALVNKRGLRKLTPEQAGRLLDPESKGLSVPFAYRFPPMIVFMLVLTAGLIGLGLLRAFLGRRMRAKKQATFDEATFGT